MIYFFFLVASDTIFTLLCLLEFFSCKQQTLALFNQRKRSFWKAIGKLQDQREGRAWDWQKPGDFGEASQMALVVKNLPTNAGDLRDAGSILGWGKIPCRRAQQPILVFLPGKFHRQQSLLGYSP